MNRIYHKGRYRNGERDKHIGPFVKRTGNKRWRLDGRKQIELELNVDALAVAGRQVRKKKKKVKVKITMESAGGFKHSYYTTYDTLKKAEAAINRYSVIRTTVFLRKGQIFKCYEKRNNRDQLWSIMRGEYNYEDLLKMAEALSEKIGTQYATSNLQEKVDEEKVDEEKIESILISIREKLYR